MTLESVDPSDAWSVLLDANDGSLIRKHLDRGEPMLTGLSATYLYRDARERPELTLVDAALDGS